MKVFLSVKDEEVIEVNLLKGEVQYINRKDFININGQSYIVNNKSIFFDSKNVIDFITLHVEKI